MAKKKKSPNANVVVLTTAAGPSHKGGLGEKKAHYSCNYSLNVNAVKQL